MTRKLRSILAYTALVAVAACGGSGGSDSPLKPGQTDFTTEEPDSKGGRGNFGAGAPEAAADGDAAGAPGAPMGRTGEVEEGDVYRIANNHLFYLNTYRGFVIYDVSNPKAPARVSRLPVFGYPVEMFVEGNMVYALLRDALYLTQDKDHLKFQRHNVSQLVAIDVTDLKNPRVVKTVDIKGELREGVARKIENTIYVVSSIPQWYSWGWNYGGNSNQQKEQAWVYSFNVADPAKVQLVAEMKVFEGGSVNFNDSKLGVSLSRNFQNVSISATSNALMVVENWHVSSSSNTASPDGKTYRCGSYNSDQQALVSIIDISDPKGAIRLHSRFETAGHLTDQFKMTYVFDDATKTGTFYGIFARQAWSGSNCSGNSVVQNTIESWDVTNGAAPAKLSSLDFGKPNETVRGSAFDVDRKVAFAITAMRIDPLYVISFADRSNLKVLSAIDGLSGDMNVFRLVADKNFLMGIGTDASATCEGFQDTNEWRPTNVAVSMIDVRDLSAIKLVQRRCVAIENAAWVGSSVNWNLDQAHKMIGMHSDGKVNVVTVPVYYTKRDQENDWWWYRSETAVGMMSWDVTAYDPTKAPGAQQVLRNFGTVVHPNGEVRRSIVFTHKGSDRRMMINLSDTHIGITDIEDLAKPVTQAEVELAPYYSQIFKFGDHIVEQVQQQPHYGYGPNQGGSEFRVKLAGGDLEQTDAVARFRIGHVVRVIKHGTNLVLFRRVYPLKNATGVYETPINEAVVMDLTDPTKPVLAGTVDLPQNLLPDYRFWCGTGGYWGGYWFDQTNNWVATADGLVFLQQDWDGAAQKPQLRLGLLGLAAGGKPSFEHVPVAAGDLWQGLYGLVADPVDATGFYLAYRTAAGKVQRGDVAFTSYRYYAQRWTGSGGKLAAGESVNLPGRLVRTWQNEKGTRVFLTQDEVYREKPMPAEWGNGTYWQGEYRLNLLRGVQPGVAELLDSHHFVDLYLRDLVLDGNKLYVNGGPAHYGGYFGGGIGAVDGDIARPGLPFATTVAADDVSARSDRFMIFDVGGLKLNKVYDKPTATYNMQLMGTYAGKLFVNLPGDGVLVVDASNPAAPKGQQFMRTLGYASHIEFAGDNAYVASGYFGVYQMKLTSPPLIVQN